MSQPVDNSEAKSSTVSIVTELPPQIELKVCMPIPEFDLMKAKKKMDSIFKVRGLMKDEQYVRVDDDDPDEDEETKADAKASETSSLKTDMAESEEDEEETFRAPPIEFY